MLPLSDGIRARRFPRTLLLVEPGWVTVSAHDGVVTLAGQASTEETRRIGVQLASGADGVAYVVDHLTVASAARCLGNGD
jgi:hypothetical protein